MLARTTGIEDALRAVDQFTAAALAAQQGDHLTAMQFEQQAMTSGAFAALHAASYAAAAATATRPAAMATVRAGMQGLRSAARLSYGAAMSAAASPGGQGAIQFGRGYSSPDKPATLVEATGAAAFYYDRISDHYYECGSNAGGAICHWVYKWIHQSRTAEYRSTGYWGCDWLWTNNC